MRRLERGQSLIMAAVLLAVLLFFLLAAVELFRLILIQEDLIRAAEAAGKSGLVLVGDQIMFDQIESERNAENLDQASSAGSRSAQDNAYLVSAPMQTQVAEEVIDSLERNGYQLEDPDLERINIEYPALSPRMEIALKVQLEIRVDSLFSDVLFLEEGVITGRSLQTIPQR